LLTRISLHRALSRPTLKLLVAFTILCASGLGLGVQNASAATLTATWTDNANGTAFFKVERKTGTTGTYSQIGTTPTGATSFSDSTLTSGTTYCYRVRASNSSGDSPYSNEACKLAGGTFDVTVRKAGTGTGTVTSNPTGVSCGSDCFESYTAGRVVTLSAAAASGSVFAGWSGGGCSGTSSCTTTGNAPITITATFNVASTPTPTPTSYTLSVSRSGTGSGAVTSNPSGISCGSDCSETLVSGTVVTLTASPTTGSVFGGWGGACSGTGTCTVTMSGARSVSATFTAATTTTTYSLTVTKSGTGSGTVVSNPSGVSCGTDCSHTYTSGTAVTLTATPASGSAFAGWSGACSGTGACTVTMSGARSVGAAFTANPVSSPSSSACPCTIWASTATPAIYSDPDSSAVEIGVKFRADVNGYITGIRYYKSTQNTGTHVGHLWTSGGTLLATVTFTNETSAGWQQANLSTPVAITANTTYVVSYYTSVGRYSVTENYFGSSIYRAPLRALSNGFGGNGVYRYGRGGGFPNQTYRSSNYWVDVVFKPR
jgi:hypothetical protein